MMNIRCGLKLVFVFSLMSVAPMFSQVIHTLNCSVDLEILALPRCATVTRGNRTYISAALVRPMFKGVASRLANRVLPDSGWAYFDRTGLVRVKGVAPFDNEASQFHFGLVRVERDGKYGLATERGVLISSLYDGMSEFDHERPGWKACSSCRIVKHGDYTMFKGGNWFWLNRKGQVVGGTEAH